VQTPPQTSAAGFGNALTLGRITQRTTPESVADVLRSAILDGTLKPGSPLRENQLAAELHVSRAPLRDALALLADRGLVTRIPYRGAFVAQVGADDIAEIANLRRRVEPYAIELAMPHLKGGARAKLVRALDDMAAGADDEDAAATIGAHMGFHRACYELSGHRRLLELWQSWEPQLQLFFSADHQSFVDLHVVVVEHRRLLTAIDSGDLNAIVAELDRHFGGAKHATDSGYE
jgi:DNA-binding GntR family transcriptional regulator